jgi:hypothetical protein
MGLLTSNEHVGEKENEKRNVKTKTNIKTKMLRGIENVK